MLRNQAGLNMLLTVAMLQHVSLNVSKLPLLIWAFLVQLVTIFLQDHLLLLQSSVSLPCISVKKNHHSENIMIRLNSLTSREKKQGYYHDKKNQCANCVSSRGGSLASACYIQLFLARFSLKTLNSITEKNPNFFFESRSWYWCLRHPGFCTQLLILLYIL